LGGMGKKVEKLYNLYANLGLNVKMKLYQDVRHELTSDFDKDIVIREMVEFFDGNITR
jgi:esterase/lipase